MDIESIPGNQAAPTQPQSPSETSNSAMPESSDRPYRVPYSDSITPEDIALLHSATPTPPQKPSSIPIVFVALTIIIAIAFVIAGFLSLNHSSSTPTSTIATSADVIRNYCNKYRLDVSETADDSTNAKSIKCVSTPNSLISSVPSSIEYTTFSTNVPANYTSSATLLEENDSYKKYYLGDSPADLPQYIIVGGNTGITVSGYEPNLRTVLVELGFPDQNWQDSDN